jgi:DNA-binding transcriptional ArsR family regulator
MPNSKPSESPLEAAAGAAGPRATEAFAVLGHETRLAILLALWEAYEPFEAENSVSFATLRKRVGMRDGSQFNYHLKQLVGHFVRRTDDGYELRRAGREIVQTVIAGTGIEEVSLAPTEIDRDCYLCGAPTMVTYQDEVLFWICTECDGLFHRETFPEGTLGGMEFDPAGFADRSPGELLNAAWTGGTMQSGLGGLCDACSGPMESWLHVCDDHATEGVCPTCGWRDAAVGRFRCTACKRNHGMVPWYLVINHPAVVAFYYDHGVPLLYEGGVKYQPRIEMNLQAGHEQELVSRDPPRVRVTIQYEGDELQLTMDEEVNVIDVTEGA